MLPVTTQFTTPTHLAPSPKHLPPLTEASALPSVSPVLGGCGGGGGGAAPLYMGEPADMCGETAVGVEEGGARNEDMDGRLEAMSAPPPPHTCRHTGHQTAVRESQQRTGYRDRGARDNILQYRNDRGFAWIS